MGKFTAHVDRSSIGPVFVTLTILELPTLLIVGDLLMRQLLTPLIPFFILLLDAASLAAMTACIYTDPGVLPQNVNNYEWSLDLLELPPVNHNLVPERNYLIVHPSGLSVTQKYCMECHIYRPLRSIHCRTCNHCVERYDHHCPWLGVCIGKYNYRYFCTFLVLLNLTVMLAAVAALVVIVQRARDSQSVLSYLV
jgi:palmitoyltransferase ZDHHC9/14/18